MEADLSHAERPAKRQKIEDLSGLPLATIEPEQVDYIVLAEQFVHVRISDVELYKSLTKPNCSSHVEIIHLDNSHPQSIQIRVPWLKLNTKIDVITDTSVTSTSNLIDCCRLLPSTIKKGKQVSGHHLCKCEAFLHLFGQQPRLRIRLLWHNSTLPRERVEDTHAALLRHYTLVDVSNIAAHREKASAWTVKEFYDNVHVPSIEQTEKLKLDMVECTLYPFQDRATRWMLSREGMTVLPSGQIVATERNNDKLPLDFRMQKDVNGRTFYSSAALNIASTSRDDIETQFGSVRGGILAEAMGLGKTVEMIALMCSHKRGGSLHLKNADGLRDTSATLIITPPTILEQWRQEITEHAPGLRVYHYTGMKAHSKNRNNFLDVLAKQDVVLTTYNVIASEVHYVKERPDRFLRARPRRELPKSPLTQILWWRCLLDEAQMVESGVSNAATVARLIPRVNAWAVTGTPLKQSHRDLYGLLLFLRYEPWCLSTRIWDHIVINHRVLFRKLITEITLRHSKELVRDELRIPPQLRQVASLPFTAVEESHYAQLHQQMQEDCGLDSLGAPLDGEWDPDSTSTIEKMRSWLQRLRQTCLHPEVGGRNRKALGRRQGPLRTVAQVLEVMIEQSDSSVHTEQRTALMAKADRARVYEHARQSQIAQDIFKEALSEVVVIVADARRDVANEVAKVSAKGENLVTREDSDTEDEEEPDNSLTTARQRLRSALELEHICTFFIGNTYFQLKSQEESLMPKSDHTKVAATDEAGPSEQDSRTSDLEARASEPTNLQSDNEATTGARIAEYESLESKAYEQAKAIRIELLRDVQMKAQKRIEAIRVKERTASFVVLPSLDFTGDDFGGIEGRRVFEKLYRYCRAMDEQANQFREIRGKMVNMLNRALVDEEEGVELTGDEYEDSTNIQSEMYVVMEILRALLADRRDAISGQENHLLKQETKTFRQLANDGDGHAPELMLKLLNEREAKRINPAQDGSLRGITTEIRSLVTSLEWQEATSQRARAELAIVTRLLQYVQQMLAAQTKSITALEQEVSSLNHTMNARLSYYRVLQKISDMVAPIADEELVGKPVDKAWVLRLRTNEETALGKLSVALSKRRYLLHLRNESEKEGEARICTICQFEFESGTLTVCGHQFCKECISMWWSEHRNCPVCKRRLTLNDFHDITYKPLDPKSEEKSNADSSEQQTSDQAQSTDSNPIYTTIPAHNLAEIRMIDTRGSSYGSKVDTLIRHVLWLRGRDPGSKSIIFSQYRDFLNVLSRSLSDNDIVHSKFDDKDGITDFKSNPANECFLLHAKAHATGLNLVCASHVILCEPLINTAIELQAVARVHRIGQQRATTVWMYLIEGTVEEAIHDISVRRRLAHMDNNGRSQETSRAASPSRHGDRSEAIVDAANSKELQGVDLSKMFAKGNTGGEMVDKEDLWGCLFGNVSRNQNVGVKRGLADLEAGTATVAGNGAVGEEIGRYLRAEAAEERQGIGQVVIR